MIGIDGEKLEAVVRDQPYPLLFATVSGAHLYGFPSADSDYDVRGVHLLPWREASGLFPGRATVEWSGVRDGIEFDVVTHDALKFFRLLLKRNGYVLEQLMSPIVVHSTGAFERLKAIVPSLVTRHHADHYLGFARKQWALFEKDRGLKPLLYTYRVLLTGIHLMRTGEVEANLLRLNDVFQLPRLAALVDEKLRGREKQAISDVQIDSYAAEYERLTGELMKSRAASHLPDAPSGGDALNELLWDLRLSTGRGEIAG